MGSIPMAMAMSHTAAPHLHLQTTSSCRGRQTTPVPFFDSVSAVEALSSCSVASSRDSKLQPPCSCLHAKVVKSGLDANVYVNNALLHLYLKKGFLHHARKLFYTMPEPTVVTWTSMVSGYSRNGMTLEAIQTFFEMLESCLCPNEFTLAAVLHACSQGGDLELSRAVHGYAVKSGFGSDEFLQTSLVSVYAKCGVIDSALKILCSLGLKNVVAWSSVLSGCVSNGMIEDAIHLFFTMNREGIKPNEVTLLSILHACSLLRQEAILRWAQGLVMKLGFYDNYLVMNSLVEMYVMNDRIYEGVKAFCGFGFEGNGKYLAAETMASLTQGCAANSGFVKLVEPLHGYLTKHGFFPCVIIENSLIDVYGEIGKSECAMQIFSTMKNKDSVSLNSMASCLVKNGRFHEALMLIKETC